MERISLTSVEIDQLGVRCCVGDWNRRRPDGDRR